ncbi:hypothetical protein RHGRI_007727 [Rhododendron griersonianum]|uniref:Uncharacterized protein n=1 Tax=Rhododendron griersonianum TaxID=479676 RepID=A0AAV6KZQ6_9ERIC|nr:hypothetical protein RHGRI_007727 [Rhododendron griersonianum]
MDPTFAIQLADEWSKLQDLLENTVGSDFSFRDPYVPAEFPILYAQYQQLMANLPNQREEDEDPEEPPEEDEDPEEPPEEEEDPEEPAEEEEDPEEPPDRDEEMDNAEHELEGDAGNSTDSEDGFLAEPEMDDYGWLLPIDAPRDMDAELQWWLTNQRLEMQEPLPPPAPVPMEESNNECEVIDADPPPRPKMTRPAGIPWVGHHSGYDPNTWVYIQLEPLYPCPFKIRA